MIAARWRQTGGYAVIAVATGLVFTALVRWSGAGREEIVTNLATELFGLVITLAFVQRYFERQERARRLRGSIGAVRRTARALAALTEACASLAKGSLERAPEPRPTSLAEVLAPDLTAALAYCDAGASAPLLADVPEAREVLRDVVVRGGSLDPIYLGALDELVDDPFLALLVERGRGLAADGARHTAFGTGRIQREAFFDRLLLAVELHNEVAAEAARLRDRRDVRRAGAFTGGIGVDRDLAVPVGFAPEWWSVAPRPGALRAATRATVRKRDAAFPEADDDAVRGATSQSANSGYDSDLRETHPPVWNFPSRRIAAADGGRA